MWLVLIAAGFAQTTPLVGAPSKVAYPLADAASKRFVDDTAGSGATFEKGKALRVILREKGWARVRDGDTYGWLPESKLSDTAPAPPPIEITLPE